MSQIKVGDTVSRVEGDTSFLWERFVGDKKYFLVTSKQGKWLQLDGVHFEEEEHPWYVDNFEKVAVEEKQTCWACIEKDDRLPHTCKETKSDDVVKAPKHYQFFPDVEAIEIIASSLSVEGFRGYCIGNRLKYRLRAGNKDKLEQDIAKSDFYIELFNNHKHLCKDA